MNLDHKEETILGSFHRLAGSLGLWCGSLEEQEAHLPLGLLSLRADLMEDNLTPGQSSCELFGPEWR